MDAVETAEAEPKERGRFAAFQDRLLSVGPGGRALGAFLLYLAISVILYAAPILTRFSSRYVGVGRGDSNLFIWSLAWMPHALSTLQNPLYSHDVWAPHGVDLSWMTNIPGPSLVMSPVTKLFGPLISYNVLLIVAPALAGWAAYLLCHRATKAFWPSLAGGYLFGFSTYMVGEMHGHVFLVLVFPIALAVYLVVRRVEGTFGPVAFTVLITVLLVAMYSITTEEFATMVMFGGLALLVAFVFSSREVRGRLLRTAGLIVVAGGVAGIVLSPYLYDALRHVPPRTIRSATHGSADLLGFVVPRTSTWIGGHTMRNVSAHFTAGVVEDGSYLSIPLVIGLVVFAVMRRRDRATWILLSIAAAAVLLSLGPVLHVKGHQSVTLPEDVLTHLPVVKNVAPVRFALYMWLAVAVAVAAWLALPGRLRWLRWAVVVLSAVLILPDVASPPYHPPVRVPPFITDGLYRRYLSPGEIVLIVPYGKGGEMLWQADAEMYFRIPRGYIGPLPAPYVNQPLARNLATGLPSTIPAPFQLRTFLQLHQVDAIAVADPHPKAWDDLIRPIGGKSIHAGDVDLYRLSR